MHTIYLAYILGCWANTRKVRSRRIRLSSQSNRTEPRMYDTSKYSNPLFTSPLLLSHSYTLKFPTLIFIVMRFHLLLRDKYQRALSSHHCSSLQMPPSNQPTPPSSKPESTCQDTYAMVNAAVPSIWTARIELSFPLCASLCGKHGVEECGSDFDWAERSPNSASAAAYLPTLTHLRNLALDAHFLFFSCLQAHQTKCW